MISDATMSRLMERRGLEARPHGFRSSLRVWLSEQTDAPFEVAEAMLAHIVGNSVTRAYQRSDFLDQRKALLERWAEYVSGEA
jgi:integrase